MDSVSVPIPRRRRLELASLVHWAILAVVIVLVVWPVLLIVLNSFQVARPGQPAVYTLEAWRNALSDRVLLSTIWNTFTLLVARQAVAFPLAIFIAWIIARTDIKGSHWLEFLFWIGFFIPPLPSTLGWIMLLDPDYGLINKAVALLPLVDNGPFNIYSFWGQGVVGGRAGARGSIHCQCSLSSHGHVVQGVAHNARESACSSGCEERRLG